MVVIFHFLLVFMLSFSSSISKDVEISPTSNVDEDDLETYIVHVELPSDNKSLSLQKLEDWYETFLPNDDDGSRLVYPYQRVIAGFAAKLTPEEVEHMKTKKHFVSARRQRTFRLQTTHSPGFLGLQPNKGFWKESNYGKHTIIGVLDTGVDPSHPSFNDTGVPEPPSGWKGKCGFAGNPCNKKIIGGRNFIYGQEVEIYLFDSGGHGSLTASTAAGNFVPGASLHGNANGTAAGIAPLAHLAIYPVCYESFCSEIDIAAAIDAAILGGVDVLSMSFGHPDSSIPFHADIISVGAFRAAQNGIFVSCAAGNFGPDKGTVVNNSPWILTVGASTIDRSTMAVIRLGNGMEFCSESLQRAADGKFSPPIPLVYPGRLNQSAAFCAPGSLGGINVTGKIVLCDHGGQLSEVQKGIDVKNAGGAAMILMNEEAAGYTLTPTDHVLPAADISYKVGLAVKSYANSTKNPTASISFKGTVTGIPYAPSVASFSSRGPNNASLDVLKPDIIGPGVNILAAFPFPTESDTYSRLRFAMTSGTSISCPHLSGVAALLKSSHPEWSPAIVKSAIMTSADVVNRAGYPISDQTLLPADIFATGAGHVNPEKANDPGLVYDMKTDDYLPYLCSLGYNDQEVEIITRQKVNCSKISNITGTELNYPSFSLLLGYKCQTYKRTVTNVGHPVSCYKAVVTAPKGVFMQVKPSKLCFHKVWQDKTYEVKFRQSNTSSINKPFAQGFLRWVSSQHNVRSAISVLFI